MSPFERNNLVAYEQGRLDSTRIAVRFNGPAESGTSLGLRRTSGRRASCSAEQMTGHAYDGEAPTVLGVGFEICLNEQFYALLPLPKSSTRIGESPKSTSCRRRFVPRLIA